jgi:AraC family transcriptional regulator, regulatory protein of adaptative response / methylated-DNA-[protein]-cysteine methyltransferase
MIKITKIETPLGEMIAGSTKDGVCLLEFSDRKSLSSEYHEITKLLGSDIESGSNKHIRMLKKQLKEYFKGKRKEFSLILLTPGTEFQQTVWKNLEKIPYGNTISYQEQAEAMNNPEGARAVASANASNRIAIIIPCHRVIGSDGNLVGYGGGLKRKKWLLDHEKKFSGQAVDLELFNIYS